MSENAEYVCTLTEASLKVAQEELGEDPKQRLSQVETFRTWIKEQKHIKAPTDTLFLLKFLRTAKFSQLRAREVLEGNLKLKAEFPEWMNNIDMADPDIQEFLATGYMYVLPKRSPTGRLYVCSNAGALDLDKKWDRNTMIKAIFGLTYYYSMGENDLVNGIEFFQDLTHFSMKIVSLFGIDTIKKTTKAWQGNFPGRFKAFHYFNSGAVMESIMAICRPLMKKKFLERMRIHGKNMEDVYKDIPMEYFPDEYLPDDYKGPSQGPMKEIVENMCAKLRSPEIRQRILYETNSEWSYDLSMKPDDVPSESFRKLNVD